MSDLVIQQQHQVAPFGQRNQLSLHGGMNNGAIAIEQERAVAEAQGQLTLAKRFPRSMAAALQEFLESCQSADFAKTAFYTVPNRGSGPSIRFAEEAARCYGNFQYGHRELSRTEGKSEIEVFAWDMQNNNYSKRQITVMHVMDTKSGPRKLIDQADIDNKIANVASKQMRGRILALLPKHLLASGQEACKRTLAGGGEKPVRERIQAMVQRFSQYGVTTKHLEAHLGHGVDETTLDELADLTGIFTAVREGAKASEFFQLSDATTTEEAPKPSGLTETARRAPRAPKAAPAPAPVQAPAAAQEPAPAQEESNTAQNESNPAQEQAPAPEQQETQASAPDSGNSEDFF